MPKNTLTDLRNHLFATLEHLTDENNPMKPETAAAVVKVAETIIESAKVEVKAIEVLGELSDSAFFTKPKPKSPALTTGTVGRKNGHDVI
jgi:hypothetical protein